MGRPAKIPHELTRGPFTLAEALAAGVSADALRSTSWQRIGKGLYCWVGWRREPWPILQVLHRIHPGTTFSGLTAAYMHGLDCSATDPVEVIAPPNSSLRSCHGLRVRHCKLTIDSVVPIRGLPATSIHRTLRDICAQSPGLPSLIVLDMALRARIIARNALNGIGLMSLAEPAESQMETRLRWLLTEAGLPRPQVQVDLRADDGRFLGRADMYYPQARLVVEFDGGNHRDRLVSDDRRQNELVGSGFTVLRFTSADLHARPHVVVMQVRGALSAGFVQMPRH